MGLPVLDKVFGYNNGNESEDYSNEEIKNLVCKGLRIIRPIGFQNDIEKITKLVREGNIVAFNLENLNPEDGIRTIDYISGATTVLGGRIVKVTDKVYVSVPNGIDVENIEETE